MSSTVTVPQMAFSVILDEIEERANKATEGPWDYHGQSQTFAVSHVERGVHKPRVINGDSDRDEEWKESWGGVLKHQDAIFIASARTDVPALVKALRKALMVAKVMPSAAYERITENFQVDMLPNDLQADYDTLEQEVTAILNQGRQT